MAAPRVAHLHFETSESDRLRRAERVDEGPAGGWINAAVLASQQKDHHIAAIGQLEAEPVPTDGTGRQGRGTELMVHPAQPLHGNRRLTRDGHGPGRLETGQGIVATGALGRGPLAAVSVDAVPHRRLDGRERQPKGKRLARGFQAVPIGPQDGLPIVYENPQVAALLFPAGHAERLAGGLAGLQMPIAGDVRHRGVGQVELIGTPGGVRMRPIGTGAGRGQLVAEESELKSDRSTGTGAQVARIVPPFGAESRVRGVIAREGQSTGTGDLEIPRRVVCAADARCPHRQPQDDGNGEHPGQNTHFFI